MVYDGELGFIPPSVDAHIKILCRYNRLRHLPREKFIRRPFDCFMSLHNQVFNTWIGSVKELIRRLRFDIEDTNITDIKLICKSHVRNSFIGNWIHQINDIHINPFVRTYAISQHSFGFEPYLKQISDTSHRNAIKLHTSSHSLAIERGRHLGTTIQERLCNVCNVIEDGKRFLFEWCINEVLRFVFNSRVSQLYPQYQYLDSDQKLVFLFEIEDE